MNVYAPIGLTVYSRKHHLKQTVDALKKNTIARYSNLYIFSDGAKKGDENKVSDLRKYLREIDGFKSIEIIERDKNSRVENNRRGFSFLLNKFGKFIWLAEDIISAPGFLTFMNEALEYFKDDESILSITGYSPPIKIPKDYNKDYYVLNRFNGWGFGTWGKKFDPFGFKIDYDEYCSNLRNNSFYSKLVRNGEDIPRMLRREMEDGIDALDVRIMYYQAYDNMRTICPKQSLTNNIGMDGTGEHSGVSNRFNVDLWQKTDFEFDLQTKINPKIEKENYWFWSGPSVLSAMKKKVINQYMKKSYEKKCSANS